VEKIKYLKEINLNIKLLFVINVETIIEKNEPFLETTI
jgi:hypothetical protein